MARARVLLSQKQLEGLELQLIHAVTVLSACLGHGPALTGLTAGVLDFQTSFNKPTAPRSLLEIHSLDTLDQLPQWN